MNESAAAALSVDHLTVAQRIFGSRDDESIKSSTIIIHKVGKVGENHESWMDERMDGRIERTIPCP